MTFATVEKIEPKVEWMASYQGMPIYIDESLPKGTIQFRSRDGQVIGTVTNVEQIRIGGHR